ncbi:MAG TPA: hypothetical protein VN426_06170 [Syntrophomonadaceae bacterium]|nr:hypothetical protein [Syntrophomonadaceae bacterium]
MVMVPGIQTVETYQDRKILAFLGFAGPIVSVLIAASQGELLAGTVLGKKSSDSQYAPVRRSTLSAGEAIGQTVLSVTDPKVFSIGQTVSIQEADGSEVENLGAITAKDDTTVTVTTALTAAKSSGAYIYVADGSETALVILNENVPNQNVAVNAEACLGGVFYTNMLVGMDALAKKALGARVVDSVTIVPV